MKHAVLGKGQRESTKTMADRSTENFGPVEGVWKKRKEGWRTMNQIMIRAIRCVKKWRKISKNPARKKSNGS